MLPRATKRMRHHRSRCGGVVQLAINVPTCPPGRASRSQIHDRQLARCGGAQAAVLFDTDDPQCGPKLPGGRRASRIKRWQQMADPLRWQHPGLDRQRPQRRCLALRRRQPATSIDTQASCRVDPVNSRVGGKGAAQIRQRRGNLLIQNPGLALPIAMLGRRLIGSQPQWPANHFLLHRSGFRRWP